MTNAVFALSRQPGDFFVGEVGAQGRNVLSRPLEVNVRGRDGDLRIGERNDDERVGTRHIRSVEMREIYRALERHVERNGHFAVAGFVDVEQFPTDLFRVGEQHHLVDFALGGVEFVLLLRAHHHLLQGVDGLLR